MRRRVRESNSGYRGGRRALIHCATRAPRAIPGNDRVKEKELEKVEKYQPLKDDMAHAKSHCSACCYWGSWSRISQLQGVHEANRRESEVGSYPENSIVGDSKDTKESTVRVSRRKRESWDLW